MGFPLQTINFRLAKDLTQRNNQIAMVLRKIILNDLELIKIWFNKEHVKQFFGDPVDWINEITANLDNSDWIQYFIVIADDMPIGFIQYYDTDKAPQGVWSNEPEGTAGIDYLIGEEAFLHKGYGTAIIKNTIQLIRQTKKFSYIVADPVLANLASISVLTNNGFIKKRSGLYKFILK